MNEAADLRLPSSQESRESDAGVVTSAGHHLHALLCESRGRRHLTNRLHLFQLLLTVLSGEAKDNDAVWQWPALKKPTHTVF